MIIINLTRFACMLDIGKGVLLWKKIETKYIALSYYDWMVACVNIFQGHRKRTISYRHVSWACVLSTFMKKKFCVGPTVKNKCGNDTDSKNHLPVMNFSNFPRVSEYSTGHFVMDFICSTKKSIESTCSLVNYLFSIHWYRGASWTMENTSFIHLQLRA